MYKQEGIDQDMNDFEQTLVVPDRRVKSTICERESTARKLYFDNAKDKIPIQKPVLPSIKINCSINNYVGG